ncbi:MAG: YraN family protein [Sedimentisphaerales bacterium]|nr:YraN family protein [Sedimentisphaerales bacterium]
MPLTDREALGNWGERRAEKYLKKKGMKILTRNYKCKTGELDLVMVDTDGTVVFVEVKARASSDFAEAEDAINLPKKTKLSRTAQYFLKTQKIENRPCRFDVVTITFDESGKETIKHYQSAFVP